MATRKTFLLSTALIGGFFVFGKAVAATTGCPYKFPINGYIALGDIVLLPDTADRSAYYQCNYPSVLYADKYTSMQTQLPFRPGDYNGTSNGYAEHLSCPDGLYFCPEQSLCTWSFEPGCTFAPVASSPFSSTCDCASTASNWTIPIAWTGIPGYERRWKVKKEGCSCLLGDVEYRCTIGYYGDGTTCTKCPAFIDGLGKSHERTTNISGATSITACHIAQPYTPICPYDTSNNLILPLNPDDVGSYYECDYNIGYTEKDWINGVETVLTNGFPRKMCCPDGLYFCPEKGICTWAWESDCTFNAPMLSTACTTNDQPCDEGLYGQYKPYCYECPGGEYSIPGINTSITQCMILPGEPRQDSGGIYEYTNMCYYS
ncbi:MAG: hypothetical protein LBJ18_02350 [Rickettsiales bacterium]|nr:hypothetical protein [Rickettsiales bacterium]